MPRPFVFLNIAMTVDGKITSAHRERPSFTSQADRVLMDMLRAKADAVLIGAQTLIDEDPPFHVRRAEARQERLRLGKPPGLLNVVVTRQANLLPTMRFFTNPETVSCIVATVDTAPQEHLTRLQHCSAIWRLGETSVDLARLLERLYQDKGVRTLLCEGGGELNWGMLNAGLVDEIYITIAPALLGGNSAATPVGGIGFKMAERLHLQLLEVDKNGEELFCRYKVLPRTAVGYRVPVSPKFNRSP